ILQMTFLVNNRPFAGKEGAYITSAKITKRLMTQLETDVSLRVDDTDSPDTWVVSGRGELHLSVLIENIRRERSELQIYKTQVIIKEIDGVKHEPMEALEIDFPEEYTGPVMESLGERKGEMLNMENTGTGQVRLEFSVPSRGLLGYSTQFMSQTRGYGIMNNSFSHYVPVVDCLEAGSRTVA